MNTMFVKCFGSGNPSIKSDIEKHFGRNRLIQMIVNGEWEDAQKAITSASSRKWSAAPTLGGSIRPTEVLPIHQACAISTVPLYFIKSLVKAYPESVTKFDSNKKRTPLHLALASHASDDVILFLLQTNPAASRVQDSYGRVPLHYGISNYASIPVMEALVKACPQAIRATDKNCWTPFHVASSVSASLQVIELMLEEERQQNHPDFSTIVAMSNTNGRTPIDLAKYNETIGRNDILKRLLEEQSKVYQSPVFQNWALNTRSIRKKTFRVLSSGIYV